MKLFLTAIAMTIAVPAAAQTAAPAHAGHATAATPAADQAAKPAAAHADHECCCDKKADGEKKDSATPEADPHADHPADGK